METSAKKRICSKIQKTKWKHPVVLWNVMHGIIYSVNCLPKVKLASRITSQNMEKSLKQSCLQNDLLLQRRMYMYSFLLRTMLTKLIAILFLWKAKETAVLTIWKKKIWPSSSIKLWLTVLGYLDQPYLPEYIMEYGVF